jgi:hypothetical protein
MNFKKNNSRNKNISEQYDILSFIFLLYVEYINMSDNLYF